MSFLRVTEEIMLKIDQSITRKYIPHFVWTHISTINVSEVKTWIISLTFIWLNVFCVLPVVGNTFVKSYFLAVIIPIVILNIWGLAILFRNFYSVQMETIYFIAANGLVGLYCHFIVAQKIAYADAGATSYAFLIISSLLYVGFIIYFIYYYYRRFSDVKREMESKLLHFLGVILLFLPSNGYSFYHFYVKNNPFAEYITAFIWLLLGIFFIYIGVRFCHKILFIKANSNLFRYQQPSKKELKQALAKGKNIIVR